MYQNCGRAEVSRTLSDDYSTFELPGSKGAGRMFARSVGSHAGLLLLEVKEPVVRLRIAQGSTQDQKSTIYNYIHINRKIVLFERQG